MSAEHSHVHLFWGDTPERIAANIADIRALAERNEFTAAETQGELHHLSTVQGYIKHLLSYVDVDKLKPLKIVVNKHRTPARAHPKSLVRGIRDAFRGEDIEIR